MRKTGARPIFIPLFARVTFLAQIELPVEFAQIFEYGILGLFCAFVMWLWFRADLERKAHNPNVGYRLNRIIIRSV